MKVPEITISEWLEAEIAWSHIQQPEGSITIEQYAAMTKMGWTTARNRLDIKAAEGLATKSTFRTKTGKIKSIYFLNKKGNRAKP